MNIRKYASLVSATALLGLSIAACAVEGADDSSTQGSDDALLAGKNRCLTVRCTATTRCNPRSGRCEPIPSVCQYAKCANGYHCEEPVGCVPNAPDCSAVRCVAGTKNIPGLGCCIKTCGGFLGTPCAGNDVCVDDPTDNCDPKNGGADCAGICQPPVDDCPGQKKCMACGAPPPDGICRAFVCVGVNDPCPLFQ